MFCKFFVISLPFLLISNVTVVCWLKILVRGSEIVILFGPVAGMRDNTHAQLKSSYLPKREIIERSLSQSPTW